MIVQAGVVPRGPDFPDSDGDPMPERASHQKQLFSGKFVFEQWLKPYPRVYVGGNQFLYYNPANQKDNLAPDIFVVLDVERREREKYQTWDEGGKFPDLVVEILSPTTRKEDLGAKKELYARLGALEYYVHDPRPGVRRRLFDGWQLVDGVYLPFPKLVSGGIWSQVLGAELRPIGQWLRLIDPACGQPMLYPDELDDARQAAEARAGHEASARQAAQGQVQREAAARHAAEDRLGRLEREQQRILAELAQLRAQVAGDRNHEASD